MKLSRRKAGLMLLNVVMIGGVISVLAFGVSQTFTGTVGDAMCGAKHIMPGSEIDCTQACVSKGSRYSLLVGDKVYTLVTDDKVVLAALDKRAGAKVTVTGAEKESIITVTSVKPAR